MRLSKKRSLIYGCLIILMLIVAGGSLILNQLNDIDKLKTALGEKIEALTQLHVTIRDVELDIHRGVGVTLHDVSLRRNPKGPPNFTAQEIWVEFGLLPLLGQELVIEKMLMRGSSIKVVRGPDGRMDFVGLNTVFDRRTPLEDSFFKIVKMGRVPQLVIQNGEIRFFDYYENSNPVPIQFQNINASIKKTFSAPSFSFLFRGNLVGSKNPSPFSIFGKLRNSSGGFDASHLTVEAHVEAEDWEILQFRPYLKQVELFNSEQVLLSTDSDFSWSLDGRLILSGTLKYRHKVEDAVPTTEIPATSRRGFLDYKIQWFENTFEVKAATFKFGDFELNGSGRVEQWRSPDPKITFAVQSNALSVDTMHTFPPFSIFPKPIRLIQETLQQGQIEIRSLNYDGTLSQLNHLEKPFNLARLSGELGLQKVNWNLPFVKLHKIGGVFRLASGDGTIQIEKALCRTAPKVKLSGSIKNVIYNPTGDLSVNGELNLTELRKLIIRDIDDPEFRRMLGRFKNLSGNGSIQIHFLGPLGTIRQLAIDGKYSFHHARLRYPGLPHEFKNIEGKIEITHRPTRPVAIKKKPKPPLWNIRFANLKGDFGRNRFSGFEGEIRIGPGKPYIHSSGQIKIHAPELPQWLNRSANQWPGYDVLNETQFVEGTLWMKIKGQGRSFDFQSLLTPYQIRAEGVSLKHAKLPQPLSGLQGNFIFTPKGIEVQHLKGRYGHSDINIQGRLGDTLNLNVASAEFSLNDLPKASWMRRLILTGPIAFESQWTGTPKTLDFTGSFDLTKTAYRYDDQFIKRANSPNHFRIQGRWTPNHLLVVKKLVYELGPNSFHGTGKIRLSPNPKFSLRVSANDLKPFSLGTHVGFLRTSRGGTIRLDLTGEGNLKDLDRAMFQGTVESKKLELQWKSFTHPIYINAKVDFLGDRFNIPSAIIASSDSEIRLQGKSSWGKNPSVELAVFSEKLDLNDVWPGIIPLKEIRDRLKNSRLFNEGSARLRLDFNRYKFLLMNLKNLSTEISIKNQTFLIHKMDIMCPNNNRIRNRGMVKFTDTGKFRIKSILQAENIEAHDFLDQLGDTFQNGLTGKAKIIQANLESEGTSLDDFTHTLNGKVSLDLASGNLDTNKMMRGVWVLFGNSDVSSSEPKASKKSQSLEYKRIAGDFLIKNGVAETENYRYETPQRKISLVGTFDLHQRKMDTVVGVAPLVGLDKFLTKIPLLGKIITAGDEESLIKTYYEVKGPFNDPTVKSIPWTSLGKRVMGIFQGIFESPVDLLTAPLPG